MNYIKVQWYRLTLWFKNLRDGDEDTQQRRYIE